MRRAVASAVLLLAVLAGCTNSPAAPVQPEAMVPNSDPCPHWGCAQLARFAVASAMITGTSGDVGIVVKDRQTGAEWRSGPTDQAIWAGSTPKLALTVALKEDEAAGRITLDPDENADIDAMLSVSDNNAADQLWDTYDRSEQLMKRWQKTYGMADASYVDGFPDRWGFVKCTPQDLANLMTYVLEKANSKLRSFIVDRMRTVGPPQQWGVWGAGPDLQPGVKDGWSIEADDDGFFHWVTATVGFVGPDERYVVAAMYDQQPGDDSIESGVHVLTDLVAAVFGAPVPAPAEIPQDY